MVHGLHPLDASARCTAISVNPGDLPASGVRLLQSTLVEASSKRPLALDHFRLCANTRCKSNEGTKPLTLPARQPTPVWICLDEDFVAGKYGGKLTLAPAQKAETQTLDLNLWASDLSIRTLGFLLIALGVYGSYWLKVVSKTERFTTAGSTSTCPKSGLTVASSVRFEVRFTLKSPPARYVISVLE